MSSGFSPAAIATKIFLNKQMLKYARLGGLTVGCNGTFEVFNLFWESQAVLSALSSDRASILSDVLQFLAVLIPPGFRFCCDGHLSRWNTKPPSLDFDLSFALTLVWWELRIWRTIQAGFSMQVCTFLCDIKKCIICYHWSVYCDSQKPSLFWLFFFNRIL